MIRDATVGDIIHLLPLVKEFARDYNMEQDLCPKSVSSTLLSAVQSGVCLLGTGKQGQIVGVISGVVAPNIWNYNKKQIDEIIFFVSPEHRNTSIGARLLKSYVEEIEGRCYISTLKLMSNSPDITKHYNNLGYFEIERSFMKTHGG